LKEFIMGVCFGLFLSHCHYAHSADDEMQWDLLTYSCWGTTKVGIYVSERGHKKWIREEYLSSYCGAQEPTLDLVVDNDWGDRFKPVRIDVQYFNIWGQRSSNWDFEVSAGRAEKVGHELHIYGDGSEALDQTVSIWTPEGRYQVSAEGTFDLKPEPRCAATQAEQYVWRDCQGYAMRYDSEGLIYYGEEDTQIVTWDIAIVLWDSRADGITILDIETETDIHYLNRIKYAQEQVDKYNATYEANGIYIRYNLVGVALGRYGGLYGATTTIWQNFNADVGIGLGQTCPNTCGCAYPGQKFYPNSGRAQVSVSACSYIVDLHEIGHSVGLAHGPENAANQGTGYIFPEFGHGWSSPFCGNYIDIMSYNGNKAMHHNSRITCEAYKALRPYSYIKDSELDDAHGNREYADAAYALNRVRYDVSLISKDDPEVEPELVPESDPDVSEHPRIDDDVRYYPNAAQMIRDRQRELRRSGGDQIER